MSDRDSCTHHFEHVKQTRPFTEREYMQCVKCGYQHPFGLFQHWDTERDGPVQDYFDAITIESSWTPPRDNGGKLPAGLDYIKNTSGRGIKIRPINIDKRIAEDFQQTIIRRFAPSKCRPIVKLRMEREGVFEGLWKWKCQKCSNTWGTSGIWEYAINDGHTHAIMKHALPEYLATHHAHNHHRS